MGNFDATLNTIFKDVCACEVISLRCGAAVVNFRRGPKGPLYNLGTTYYSDVMFCERRYLFDCHCV